MTTQSCHVACLNLPSQVRGPKADLLPHPQRTLYAIKAWEDHNITVVGLNELATVSRQTIRESPPWKLVTSTNDHRANGHEIGNGIAYRGDLWKLVDTVRLPVEQTHRDTPLKQIVVLLQRKDADKGQVAVMCVHHPTRRADDRQETDRNECIRVENEYANKVFKAGLSLILVGDFNDGHALDSMNPEKWKEGAHQEKTVDWIMARKKTGLKFGEEKFDASLNWKSTDHPGMPHVKAEFPVEVPLTELPAKK